MDLASIQWDYGWRLRHGLFLDDPPTKRPEKMMWNDVKPQRSGAEKSTPWRNPKSSSFFLSPDLYQAKPMNAMAKPMGRVKGKRAATPESKSKPYESRSR